MISCRCFVYSVLCFQGGARRTARRCGRPRRADSVSCLYNISICVVSLPSLPAIQLPRHSDAIAVKRYTGFFSIHCVVDTTYSFIVHLPQSYQAHGRYNAGRRDRPCKACWKSPDTPTRSSHSSHSSLPNPPVDSIHLYPDPSSDAPPNHLLGGRATTPSRSCSVQGRSS